MFIQFIFFCMVFYTETALTDFKADGILGSHVL